MTGSTEAARRLHQRGRRRLRVRERLHPLHRRRRVRHGRRDRQLDPEAARPRADRAARADHLQVRGRGHGPGQGVAACGSGIFGGAFNPPHIGHLVCAQEARSQLGLDRVVLVPVGEAPHRDDRGGPGSRGAGRAVRARGAGDDAPRGVADRAGAGGPSYTVDTLRAWRGERARRRAGADPGRRPGGGAAELARAREGARAGDGGGGRAGGPTRPAACAIGSTGWPGPRRSSSSTCRGSTCPRRSCASGRGRAGRSGYLVPDAGRWTAIGGAGPLRHAVAGGGRDEPSSSRPELAERIAEIASDRKAIDIRVLDLREVVSLHGLLRDLLGQHRAPDEGDPRRRSTRSSRTTTGCCPAAPRASARPAGC